MVEVFAHKSVERRAARARRRPARGPPRNAGELETLVDRVAGEAAQAKNVSIDMAGVREFDTFGAWLLGAPHPRLELDRPRAGDRRAAAA